MFVVDIKALFRSLSIYRFNREHHQSLLTLYCPLVLKRGLVFDIGAHAGDRTTCFRKLGARVISIEPQKIFATFLKIDNFFHPKVTVLTNVVSEINGVKTLQVNSRNPTVSTLSNSFIQAANDRGNEWHGQAWDHSISVHSVTLDFLITQYGVPDFIKIDVEGAELDVLNGLTQVVPAISFEFTLIQRELAFDCIRRCETLGLHQFNVSLGEAHTFIFDSWTDATALSLYISGLPSEANSGDVYASM